MSINFEVHNVTCVHIEEPSTSNGKRNHWRSINVTQADGTRLTITLYGDRESDYSFPLVIGGVNE